MQTVTFIFGLIFGLWPALAFAAIPEPCIERLKEIGLMAESQNIQEFAPVIKMLRGTEYLRYPTEFYQVLSKLKFLEGSSHHRTGGKGLRFVMMDSPWPIKGIVEQERLVAVILRYYFPEAETIRELPISDRRPGDIVIELDDPSFFEGNFLDMLLAKPANAQAASLSRNDLRRAFGLPENAKIVSVYSKPNMAQPIWESVQDFDVVFLSTNPVSLLENALPNPWPKNVRVKFLSSLSWGMDPFSGAEKLWILNDLQGYVPLLHAASNVALVRGNLNYFEALNAGTPTLLSIDPRKEEFDPLILRRGFQSAHQTGAFEVVFWGPEFTNPLAELSQLGVIDPGLRPYLVEVEGKSGLQVFVEALEGYLLPKLEQANL